MPDRGKMKTEVIKTEPTQSYKRTFVEVKQIPLVMALEEIISSLSWIENSIVAFEISSKYATIFHEKTSNYVKSIKENVAILTHIIEKKSQALSTK